MQTITTNVYTFDELNEKAKEKAREWVREFVGDYEWWYSIYSDAENIGLRITSFDLDRNRHAEGEFMVFGGAEQVAGLIQKEHGKTCETYKTAEAYNKARAEIEKEYAHLSKEEDYDDAIGLCEEEFLHNLLEDYSILLQNEYEYMYTDEYIDDMIMANEYTFTETGTRFG